MPSPPGSEYLTGRARFKTNWKNQLVLEVERVILKDHAMGGDSTYWDYANEGDLYRLRYKRNNKGLEPLI